MSMNNKNRPSFIEEQAKINGNFHNFISDQDISKNAKRIFNDISNNNMKIDQHYYYLTHPRILKTLLDEARNEYKTHLIEYNALYEYNMKFMYNITNQNPIISVSEIAIETAKRIDYHSKFVNAYWFMYNALLYIKNGADPLQAFQNIRGSGYKY